MKIGRNKPCHCGSGIKFKKCCINKITLSLCMIVKNEEANLDKCLNSVHKYMDEIIIVDTGSTDNTISIAKKYTKKIFAFDWIDDFSSARNYAINQAKCDWILSLDADEIIAEPDLKKIRELIKNKAIYAYEFVKRSYTNDYYVGDFVINDNSYKESMNWLGWQNEPNDLLFRNDERIYYEDRIHETIRKSLWRSGLPYSTKHQIPIHHYGRFDMKKKAPIYIEQVKKRYNENPNDYDNIYTLAAHLDWVANSKMQYQEVIDLLLKCYSITTLDSRITYALALNYAKIQDTKKSIDFSLQTIRLNKNKHSLIYQHLLLGYWNSGQYIKFFDTVNQYINDQHFIINLTLIKIYNHLEYRYITRNLLKAFIKTYPNCNEALELYNNYEENMV